VKTPEMEQVNWDKVSSKDESYYIGLAQAGSVSVGKSSESSQIDTDLFPKTLPEKIRVKSYFGGVI